MTHRDPTFDAVLEKQIEKAGCFCCVHRIDRASSIGCRTGLRFPACREKSNGFALDDHPTLSICLRCGQVPTITRGGSVSIGCADSQCTRVEAHNLSDAIRCWNFIATKVGGSA